MVKLISHTSGVSGRSWIVNALERATLQNVKNNFDSNITISLVRSIQRCLVTNISRV